MGNHLKKSVTVPMVGALIVAEPRVFELAKHHKINRSRVCRIALKKELLKKALNLKNTPDVDWNEAYTS